MAAGRGQGGVELPPLQALPPNAEAVSLPLQDLHHGPPAVEGRRRGRPPPGDPASSGSTRRQPARRRKARGCPVPGSRTPGRWRETSAWRHPREKAHHTAKRPLVKAAGQADHHATRLQGDPAALAPRAGRRRRGRRNLQKLQRGGRRGKAPPPEAQHAHARPRRLAMLPVRKSSAPALRKTPAPQGQCRLFMHEMTPLRFGKRTKDITMQHPRDYDLIERLRF